MNDFVEIWNWIITHAPAFIAGLGTLGTAAAGIYKVYSSIKHWAQDAKESARRSQEALKELTGLHNNLRDDYIALRADNQALRLRLGALEIKEQECSQRVIKMQQEFAAVLEDRDNRYQELHEQYEAASNRLEQAFSELSTAQALSVRVHKTKGKGRTEDQSEWEARASE